MSLTLVSLCWTVTTRRLEREWAGQRACQRPRVVLDRDTGLLNPQVAENGPCLVDHAGSLGRRWIEIRQQFLVRNPSGSSKGLGGDTLVYPNTRPNIRGLACRPSSQWCWRNKPEYCFDLGFCTELRRPASWCAHPTRPYDQRVIGSSPIGVLDRVDRNCRSR